MIEDVDRIRKENGWKPRQAMMTNTTTSTKNSSKNGGSDDGHSSVQTSVMTPEQKILARLQAEIHLREQAAQQQEEIRLQKEALRSDRFSISFHNGSHTFHT